MATKTLIIDGASQLPLSLSFAAGTLTIGARDGALVLRDLHIERIRCEVQVSDDHIVVSRSETAPGGAVRRKDLHPGEALNIGVAQLRFADAGTSAAPQADALAGGDEIPELIPEVPAPGPRQPSERGAETMFRARPIPERLARRFHIVDGADQGQTFSLPEDGTITIGKSHKYADITLNDLYVARVHCDVQFKNERVVVLNVRSQTLVNGKPVADQQELQLGDILRVGNTHLRLETSVAGEDTAGRQVAGSTGRTQEEDVPAGGADWEIVDENEGEAPLPHAPVDQLITLEDKTLGHFLIGSLLGRGQSGLVFRAQDLKKDQTVALKVLSPDFPSSDAELQHFVQALKAVPQLQHPHLVTLYGAGKTGPYCWIAREFIEGESLARLITRVNQEGQLDWIRACRVAIHMGKVLQFLHRHGVTHGNISPRNLLIPRAGKLTKLTDLMLNRALEGSHLQKAIVRKKLLLERSYMPPEQIDPYGAAAPVEDLYTLGTVLYALLTGQAPFDGASTKEVLTQVREAKVVKPRKFQPEIPAPFEAAVLKLMARRPEERFQSAADMLAVVEPIASAHEIKV